MLRGTRNRHPDIYSRYKGDVLVVRLVQLPEPVILSHVQMSSAGCELTPMRQGLKRAQDSGVPRIQAYPGFRRAQGVKPVVHQCRLCT